MNSIVLAYVMIRGSIPVFWEQKGMIEDVTITRGPEMTSRAFHKHFDDLFKTYSHISLVDLLSDTKARETILTKEYVR
jgi:synaptojanin